jgi:hypothetical protein
MPSFIPIIGQIVRPKLVFPAVGRDGTLRDWWGFLSAQGWVSGLSAAPGGGSDSQPWWDRDSSTNKTTHSTAAIATVVVWNIVTQTFWELPYPYEFLQAGTIDDRSIGALLLDPRDVTDDAKRTTRLCKARDVEVLP